MRRIRIPLAVGAALLIAWLVVSAIQKEASDDESRAATPSPPACEPEARDLNPQNRPVQPARGKPLIARERGHIPAGFNDVAYLIGQLELDQAPRLQKAAGGSVWRLPLDWGEVERTPGEADFSKYDEIYCAATDAGVRPLWTVTGIAAWAAPVGACGGPPCVRPPEAEHLPQFRRFAELAAIRYPRSAGFEAWNEPNLTGFWGGAPDPAGYQPILEAIYSGVKDGNPAAPVLGGALSNNPTDHPGGDVSLHTYLTGMLDAGTLEHMDGFGLHAYPIAPLGTDGDLFTPALEMTRTALAEAGSGVRIWVTEVGAPTQPGALPEVSPEEQAQMMADVYRELDGSEDADAVIFHTLVDPTSEVPGGPGFGFFTAPDDGTVVPKPVVCAVLEASEATTPCPDGPVAL